MHILIIPSWYPKYSEDIAGSFFREQALAIQKKNCKVGVIYPELRSLKKWRSLFGGERGICMKNDEGVPTYRFYGTNWFPRMDFPASRLFVHYGRKLFEQYILENGKPDVIHAHSLLYGGILANEIFEKYQIPFVVTEHNSAFARNLVSRQGISIAKIASSKAARKFAVSQFLAELLNERLGREKSSWTEMPNIVNDKFLQAKLKRGEANGEFVFSSVAFMNENKRKGNILKAFSQVLKLHGNARLVMVGDGPDRVELEKQAAILRIGEKVKFTGMLSRERVLLELSNSNALVLASKYETFGVVVIEALALGKPVVATRCGGPESILRAEDGILISVDSVDELAAAMRKLLLDRSAYDPIEIRQSCAARFSEDAIVRRLQGIYEEVAKTDGKS